MKQQRVVKTYVGEQGIVIRVYAAPRQPRPVTAKPKGSSKHLGRTNVFGVRV
jgi:hypothetical protein